MKALSIRQPWAWAILHGKPVENRNWRTTYRGRFLVHAAKGCTRDEYEAAADSIRWMSEGRLDPPPLSELPRGAIVGAITLTDCVERMGSRRFVGRFGFVVLAKPVSFDEPIPCSGECGFFNVPAEVEAEIRRRFG